jgi:hypothetical protein
MQGQMVTGCFHNTRKVIMGIAYRNIKCRSILGDSGTPSLTANLVKLSSLGGYALPAGGGNTPSFGRARFDGRKRGSPYTPPAWLPGRGAAQCQRIVRGLGRSLLLSIGGY